MSGGHFNYQQFVLDDIAESIEKLISENDTHGQYSDKTIGVFKMAKNAFRAAAVMAQRIDWLVSGDDSEETFHKRVVDEITPILGEMLPI